MISSYRHASQTLAAAAVLSLSLPTLSKLAKQWISSRNDAQNPNGHQPVFKLPVEVLCEIFMTALEDESPNCVPSHPTGPLVSFHTTFDPIVLGQICSYWRTIAINLPSLWAKIVSFKPTRSHVKRLKIWLERAKGCPLDLTLEDDPHNDTVDVVATRKVLSLFFAHSQKWRKIDMTVRLGYLNHIHRLVLSAAPCQELAIANFQTYGWLDRKLAGSTTEGVQQQIDDVWTYLYFSPSLRQVTWSGAVDLSRTNAPFHQLESLYIRSLVSMKDLIHALPLFHNLRLFDIITIQSELTHEVEDFVSTTLENLEVLNIVTEVNLDPLLRQLTLPSLTTLNILPRSSALPCSPRTFRDLLSRSASRPHTLSLRGLSNGADVVECLAAPELHSVKSLKVDIGKLTDAFLSLFMRRNSGGIHETMPELHSLEFFLDEKSADGMLSELLASRWHGSLEGDCRQYNGSLTMFFLLGEGCLGPRDVAFIRKNRGGREIFSL